MMKSLKRFAHAILSLFSVVYIWTVRIRGIENSSFLITCST